MHWNVGDACYCSNADHYTSITFYSYDKERYSSWYPKRKYLKSKNAVPNLASFWLCG